MKIVDRILFIFVGLFLLGVAAMSALLAVDVISISDIVSFIGQMRVDDIVTKLILLVVAVILLVVSVKVIFARPKKVKIAAYTIRKNEDGEISVSLKAIENTIKLAVAHFEEIKEVRLSLGVSDAGVSVAARLAVPTGVEIPQLMDAFREYMKEFVEKHTGAPVCRIRLVATEFKPVDPDNERKKIAAVEAKKEAEAKKNTDKFAGTHTTMYAKREVEPVAVAEEPVVVDVPAAEENEDRQ